MTKYPVAKDKPNIFSPLLLEKIKNTLRRHEQVIVFQNKRGYAAYLLCTACGYIPKCTHCDVSLTLHLKQHTLQCHYCASRYAPMYQCSRCGSNKILEKRFATEQIEAHLKDILPTYQTIRLDADTARGKEGYKKLLETFATHKADILVGTQMIVKGLDFAKVGLVAIVDGDSLLHFTDFRVHEKAFQTIQQVSGRAGRTTGLGEVYIQLYQTNIDFLPSLLKHDYISFYEQEMRQREAFQYPPLTRLIEVVFKHTKKEVAEKAAHFFMSQIPQLYQSFFIGPTEPIVGRIKNKYLRTLLAKVPKKKGVLEKLKTSLLLIEPLLYAQRELKGIIVEYNVDV